MYVFVKEDITTIQCVSVIARIMQKERENIYKWTGGKKQVQSK